MKYVKFYEKYQIFTELDKNLLNKIENEHKIFELYHEYFEDTIEIIENYLNKNILPKLKKTDFLISINPKIIDRNIFSKDYFNVKLIVKINIPEKFYKETENFIKFLFFEKYNKLDFQLRNNNINK